MKRTKHILSIALAIALMLTLVPLVSNTVSAASQPQNLVDTIPPFRLTGNGGYFLTTGNESIKMGGIEYKNSIFFRGSLGNAGTFEASFNLGGNYTTVTGIVGKIDGAASTDATVNIYGDDSLLHTVSVKAGSLPVDFSVDVSGVRNFVISSTQGAFDRVGAAELLVYSGGSGNNTTNTPPEPTPSDSQNQNDTPPSGLNHQNLVDTIPPFRLTGNGGYFLTTGNESIRMGGIEYKNSVFFRGSLGNAGTFEAAFNLEGKYSYITGIVGKIDGAASTDATVNIYGDDSLLHTVSVKAGSLPVDFSVDVSGVSNFVISSTQGAFDRVGAAELLIYGGSVTPPPTTTPPATTPPPTTTPTPGGSSSGASSWAIAEIDEAIALGFVPSELLRNYQADITRAEFCKLVVMMLMGKSGTLNNEDAFINAYNVNLNDAPFTDTSDRYIKIAYALQIVNGTGNGRFSPARTITRQEAAAMIQRASRVFEFTDSNNSPINFSDKSSVASYASPAVDFVSAIGVMNGTSGNTFSPHGSYTREQSILTMVRLYKAFPRDNYAV